MHAPSLKSLFSTYLPPWMRRGSRGQAKPAAEVSWLRFAELCRVTIWWPQHRFYSCTGQRTSCEERGTFKVGEELWKVFAILKYLSLKKKSSFAPFTITPTPCGPFPSAVVNVSMKPNVCMKENVVASSPATNLNSDLPVQACPQRRVGVTV